MQAMIIAMAIGMNIGLTAGVLFGALYQGNLYSSTLLAAVVGIAAGCACGMAFGILPALEGVMSGLMGGMMGAMLGEMITQEQSLTMLNILLTLSVSSLLLYNILAATKSVGDKKWFLKPFFTFVLLFLFLFFGTQLDKSNAIPYFNSAAIEHSHSSQDKNNKSNEIVLTVNPSEYSYTPEEISLNKGQEASITLNNQDYADHDIEIKEIAIKKKDSGHHANHGASKADFHLHASSNSSATLTFTPLETGVYEFYCSIPGHKEKGMTGAIIVN
jgi:plastocyanin